MTRNNIQTAVLNPITKLTLSHSATYITVGPNFYSLYAGVDGYGFDQRPTPSSANFYIKALPVSEEEKQQVFNKVGTAKLLEMSAGLEFVSDKIRIIYENWKSNPTNLLIEITKHYDPTPILVGERIAISYEGYDIGLYTVHLVKDKNGFGLFFEHTPTTYPANPVVA